MTFFFKEVVEVLTWTGAWESTPITAMSGVSTLIVSNGWTNSKEITIPIWPFCMKTKSLFTLPQFLTLWKGMCLNTKATAAMLKPPCSSSIGTEWQWWHGCWHWMPQWRPEQWCCWNQLGVNKIRWKCFYCDCLNCWSWRNYLSWWNKCLLSWAQLISFLFSFIFQW